MPLYERNLGRAIISNMIKAANIRDILLEILVSRETTKLDLATGTGLSVTTVSDCINLLVKGSLLSVCGTESSSGGRRPAIYRINPHYGYVIGIRVSPDQLEATMTLMDSSQIEHRRQALQLDPPLLIQIESLIESICLSQDSRHPLAIGLSIPGHLDTQKGVVLQSNCGGWISVHIKEILERHYNTAAYLDHDINCCATYLHTIGGAKHIQNLMCMFRDCPDKAALLVDGKVLRGRDNLCGLGGAQIASLADLLGLQAVLTDLPIDECPAPISLYKITSPVDVTAAIALNAEIQWFDRAYDIMRLEE